MLRQTFIAAALVAAGGASAQTEMPFALDWKFEGPAAPYFHAIDAGYFEEAGVSVAISAGQGSLDAIPKVATGAFPVGFADINSLIKFLDQNPDAPVTAVMMVYDKPPFAVVGRKSQGIEAPKDLEGKRAGRAAAGRRLGAVPDLRRRERSRHGRDHGRAGRLSHARAHAGPGRGRRGHRLLLLLLSEPRAARRA